MSVLLQNQSVIGLKALCRSADGWTFSYRILCKISKFLIPSVMVSYPGIEEVKVALNSNISSSMFDSHFDGELLKCCTHFKLEQDKNLPKKLHFSLYGTFSQKFSFCTYETELYAFGRV